MSISGHRAVLALVAIVPLAASCYPSRDDSFCTVARRLTAQIEEFQANAQSGKQVDTRGLHSTLLALKEVSPDEIRDSVSVLINDYGSVSTPSLSAPGQAKHRPSLRG